MTDTLTSIVGMRLAFWVLQALRTLIAAVWLNILFVLIAPVYLAVLIGCKIVPPKNGCNAVCMAEAVASALAIGLGGRLALRLAGEDA